MEVTVDSVWIRMRKDGEFDNVRRFPRWVLILREKDGERALNIFIGPSEANALSMQLAGLQPARPLTYAFISRLLAGVKARVESVTVSDLVEDTFLAKVALVAGRTRSEVDARPSDAINLAMAAGAPLFVADAVLQRAGYPFSEITDRLEASVAQQENDGLEWRSGVEWIQSIQEREHSLMREERASVQFAIRSGPGPKTIRSTKRR